MRRIASISLAAVLVLTGGQGAWAKTKLPAKAHVPAPRAVTAGLRGVPPAPATPTPTLQPSSPPSLAVPRESALLRLGGPGTGLASAAGAGLRARTDPAPLCRTTCAEVRYRCLANDQGDGCDGNWTRCVLACREPPRP